MNLAGTLTIHWYPIFTPSKAYALDEPGAEYPNHPGRYNPLRIGVDNVTGAVFDAWVCQRTPRWEFIREDSQGVHFAVETDYECANLLRIIDDYGKAKTVLDYTVRQYLLYVESDLYFSSNPVFRGLDNVVFRRRDELTRAYWHKVSRTYQFYDRLTVWRERFGHFGEDSLKLMGGPSEWDVSMTIGAVREDGKYFDKDDPDYPAASEQLDVIYGLIDRYRATLFDWRKNYEIKE